MATALLTMNKEQPVRRRSPERFCDQVYLPGLIRNFVSSAVSSYLRSYLRLETAKSMAFEARAATSAHCEKWLRKSHSCWKRLAEARYARMKSYYTAVSTSAAVLVGMLAL